MRARRKAGALAMLLLTATAFAAWAPSSLWRRFESIRVAGVPANGDETSVQARLDVLVAGARMIEGDPFFSVGLDRFKALSTEYNPGLRALSGGFVAHDTYVQVGAEAGVPALALFIAVMLAGFVNCRKAQRLAHDRALAGIAGAMRLALLAYAVAALFLSAEFLVWYWLLIFLSCNLREIAVDTVRLDSPCARPSASADSRGRAERYAVRYA